MAWPIRRFLGGKGFKIQVSHVVLMDDIRAALINNFEYALNNSDKVTLPTVKRTEIEKIVRDFMYGYGEYGANPWGDNFDAEGFMRAEKWANEQIYAAWPELKEGN